MRTCVALLALILAAPVHAAPALPGTWQEAIREPDRKRLAGLWSAWTRSLAEIDRAGQTRALAALGPVADAAAGRPMPPPPPGLYTCRALKLGIRADGRPPAGSPPVLVAADPGPCRIAETAGKLWFEQRSGSQRLGGRLYPDGERMVFLGSMALAGEMGLMAYGADGDRDQVGVLRGLGDGHWRLELPWPMWQSNLVVIEISENERIAP